MTTVTMAQAILVLAPGAQFSIVDNQYSTLVWLSPDIPVPPESQVVAQMAVLQEEQPFVDCKNQASRLLYQTDWTTISDVADPAKSDPYLTNQAAFVAYRSQVRALAVTPVADPIWPVQPTAQWS
jgi:hypothetical protein